MVSIALDMVKLGLGSPVRLFGAWAKYCKDLQNSISLVTFPDVQELYLRIGGLEALHTSEGDSYQSGRKRVTIPLKFPWVLQNSTAPRSAEAASP